jgi:integrase
MITSGLIVVKALGRGIDRPKTRLHNLRHATLMIKTGVHPKIVSERLGHATVAFTLDTYSHVAPGLQEAAARVFDECLPKPSSRKATTINVL